MNETTAKGLLTAILHRSSVRWMDPDTKPRDPDTIWSETFLAEADGHLHIPKVATASEQVIHQGPTSVEKAAELKAAMRDVDGLEEILSNPAMCSCLFEGPDPVINIAHETFAKHAQVALHWYAINTTEAMLQRIAFQKLWNDTLKTASMDESDEEMTTWIAENGWHNGPRTASQCLPPRSSRRVATL